MKTTSMFCTWSLAALSLGFALPLSMVRADAPKPAEDDIDNLPVKAPDVGSSTQRTSTGSRGGGPTLNVYLLAPDTAGATVKEHPTIYWYLDQKNEDDTEVVVTEVESEKPTSKLTPATVVMRKTYAGTQAPGLYAATIDEHLLKPDRLYKITVEINIAGSGGTCETVNSVGYLKLLPASVAPANENDPIACRDAGLFYDAVDAAIREIERNAATEKPHRILHGLIRGNHSLYTAVPATNGGDKVAKEKETARLDAMTSENDAVIMTKPPVLKPKAGK